MASAATWLAIGAIGSLAGAGISAYSSYEGGMAQQRWNDYNAIVALRDAEAAKQTAEYEARQKRKETERLLSRQKALYGKAGVALEGSPLLMMEETAAEGELDALMIERTGKLYEQRYMSEAALSRMRGGATRRAGYYGAGSTLLTGAGSAASTYGYSRMVK